MACLALEKHIIKVCLRFWGKPFNVVADDSKGCGCIWLCCTSRWEGKLLYTSKTFICAKGTRIAQSLVQLLIQYYHNTHRQPHLIITRTLTNIAGNSQNIISKYHCLSFHSMLISFFSSCSRPPPFPLKTTLAAVQLTAMVTVLKAARGGRRQPNPQDKAITFTTSATHSSPREQEVLAPPLSKNKIWHLLAYSVHPTFITRFSPPLLILL